MSWCKGKLHCTAVSENGACPMETTLPHASHTARRVAFTRAGDETEKKITFARDASDEGMRERERERERRRGGDNPFIGDFVRRRERKKEGLPSSSRRDGLMPSVPAKVARWQILQRSVAEP